MTNHTVRTKIVSGNQTIDFQEYFVKNQTENKVTDVAYQGAAKAEPAPGAIEAINKADRIIICPSNPILSIGPILSIPKIRQALQTTEAQVIAISPIIAGKTVRGPADKILASMGYAASAQGVAEYYVDIIDRLIVDRADTTLIIKIRKLGLEVTVADTVMRSLEDSARLARIVLN
jgi:LPPG:FO 2-phospho-L-lactate transferase